MTIEVKIAAAAVRAVATVVDGRPEVIVGTGGGIGISIGILMCSETIMCRIEAG